MTPTPLPEHAVVTAELQALEASLDASELHGSLCGYLAGGGTHDRQRWFASVMADPLLASPEADSAIDQLYLASTGQLESPDFGFELLLPAESSPVDERGDALLAWCRGFLGGFGLAAGAESPLSEDSREALADMARIAASELSYEEPEVDAEALEEVGEFVRVAALLLHSDCVLGPRHRRRLN